MLYLLLRETNPTEDLKVKGNEKINTVHVKCYNYRKKGHFGRNCPLPANVPLFTKTPKSYVCSHAYIGDSVA